jgi:hypothetical protein
MTSLASGPSVSLLGAQSPRVSHLPSYVSSSGDEAIELCAMAGLHLDPWQQFVLRNALGERADGKWSAFEVGVMVERQNGKGGLLEARELAGLFLLGERLIIHTAHLFDTSLEAFNRLEALIDDTPELSRLVARNGVQRAHGKEGIKLKNGQRIRFRTRTKGGGRGFTADCLILDEAMEIPRTAISATLPTLSSRPNPQVWYTGSAVDQRVHEHGEVFARVRQRGIAGGDSASRLAYFEWSPDVEDIADAMRPAVSGDRENWALANPALGIRITEEYIGDERDALDARSFAVERLGVGDWPEIRDDQTGDGLDLEEWLALTDRTSRVQDPVRFAFDVTPDRAWSSIGVAGRRSDGRLHVEVVEHRRGTKWVAERVVELVRRHDTDDPVCDATGPAGSLIDAIENLGVGVEAVSAREHAQACGQLEDAMTESDLRHHGTPELTSAVRVACKRPLAGGDSWAWSRQNSGGVISPLVAVTLALGSLDEARSAPFVEVVR